MATTTFNTSSNKWITNAPAGLSGNLFLDGIAVPLPSGLHGGNNPVTCPTAQYPTIQSAVTAASPGAHITVCPGTYPEQVTIPAGKNNLTLMSYTLMTLALGIVPFTIQYFQLRTFYAFEDTRTPFLMAFTGEAPWQMMDAPLIPSSGAPPISV